MPRIKILDDDTARIKPKMIPSSKDLVKEVPRVKAGGAPSLPFQKSFNRQVTR